MLIVFVTLATNALCAVFASRWLDRHRARRRGLRPHRPRALELAERSERRVNGIYVVNETPYCDHPTFACAARDNCQRCTPGARRPSAELGALDRIDRLDDHLDYPNAPPKRPRPPRPPPTSMPGPGTRFSG